MKIIISHSYIPNKLTRVAADVGGAVLSSTSMVMELVALTTVLDGKVVNDGIMLSVEEDISSTQKKGYIT